MLKSGHFTFSDEEIDQLLPTRLRKKKPPPKLSLDLLDRRRVLPDRFPEKSGFPPDFSAGTAALAIIGKLLELEREVEKAKRELLDFKSEVRSTLSVLSTNVNTSTRLVG
jgi:hypothetical protein